MIKSVISPIYIYIYIILMYSNAWTSFIKLRLLIREVIFQFKRDYISLRNFGGYEMWWREHTYEVEKGIEKKFKTKREYYS